MDENIKSLIGWWKLKGQRENDPFVRFFFFYVCFDAWVTAESTQDIDTEKIKWFLKHVNCLKSKWPDIQSSVIKSWLANLKNLSPIEDMRRNHRGRKVYLNDTENLEEIINKSGAQVREGLHLVCILEKGNAKIGFYSSTLNKVNS